MTKPVAETSAMIAAMQPERQPGAFAFTVWPPEKEWPEGTEAVAIPPNLQQGPQQGPHQGPGE